MKSEDWGILLAVGILAAIAYEASRLVDDATNGDTEPLPSDGGAMTVERLREEIQATGLDTSKYDSIVNSAEAVFGVPAEWIKAVIGQESTFRENPPVRMGDQSYGLMQLTPNTAKHLGFTGAIPAGLLDPTTNIYLGTELIAQIKSRVGDDFSAMYSAYNSGNEHNYLTNPLVASDVQKANVWLEFFRSV